jgi:hypothetical protein
MARGDNDMTKQSAPDVRRIYADALLVQDACNLSGVVRSWAEYMETIWAEARAKGLGTDYVNTHPVNVLFASKVASLTRCESPLVYSDAYAACRKGQEG